MLSKECKCPFVFFTSTHHKFQVVNILRLPQVDEAPARAALVWFSGEYGAELLEAPYMLEPVIDSFATEAPEAHPSLLTRHFNPTKFF